MALPYKGSDMSTVKKEKQNQKYLIPNIARALSILEYLAKEKSEASVAEIADDFQYPKNSVYRIIKSLEHHGYVEEFQRKYHATPRLLYLGYAGMRNKGIIENSLDVMHALRDEVNETIMIGTLLGNQIVIIEQLPSFQYVKFTTEIGKRVTIHASAPGKAILAFLPPEEQEKILDQIKFTRYTDHTIPSKNAMLQELDTVRELGYAIDDGEEDQEAHCIGCPIFDYRGHPIAALWAVGPEFRLVSALYSKIGPVVRDHANNISRRFGYDP